MATPLTRRPNGERFFSAKFPQAFLDQAVAGYGEWHPFPKRSEHEAWQAVPESVRKAHLQLGEDALAAQWPHLPADLYLQYARVGNRRNYEKPYFERRNILGWMAIAECIEGQGRFLDPIVNALWGICEESSWCIPAHIGHQQAGVNLPDTTEPIVDLFAGETSALLAWVLYLLDDSLDTVSPLVRPRVVRELKNRILTPLLERDDFWWMGFSPRRVNNWNPWVNSNWLATVLLVEDDPQRRSDALFKIMESLDRFITPYPRDGGCDEGPSYWGRAGASLFDNLLWLYSASSGKIDIFNDELVRDIGRFVYRAHIDDEYFVNFADASARIVPDPAVVFLYGKHIEDSKMASFGAWLAKGKDVMTEGYKTRGNPTSSLGRVLPGLFAAAEMDSTAPVPPQVRDVWLPEIQVVVARDEEGSSRGFYLAAKGGHNDESHNHNDIGHWLVYIDGQPVIIDAGVETYTRKTFSDRRYEIWTMQSAYHSLPTIDGVQQAPGKEFAARDVAYSADGNTATLTLDIAGAYPSEAKLNTWKRSITLRRGESVEAVDVWDLNAPAKEITFSLITPCAVTQADPGLLVLDEKDLVDGRKSGKGRVNYDPRLVVSTERVAITDERMSPIWGPEITRIVFTLKDPEQQGSIAFRVTK